METGTKIYLAGHRGLVGSALHRRLTAAGCERVVVRTHAELDLTNQAATSDFFQAERLDYVILAAARVGGIHANDTYPGDFIRDNLLIQTNVIESARQIGVKKLLFLGSSCIYPKHAPQPMREEHLLTGPLEPTNEAYAIAKIAGLMMCRAYNRQYGTNFIAAMPTNLYGPGDNFDLQTSHVLPALIRKFHEAKQDGRAEVELWGTGAPLREFMHVDDLADACLHLMNHFDAPAEGPQFVNVGTGLDMTIRELAELIADVVGYPGTVRWNTEMPDGTPRKLLDVSRLHALGWDKARSVEDGVRQTYAWYVEHAATL